MKIKLQKNNKILFNKNLRNNQNYIYDKNSALRFLLNHRMTLDGYEERYSNRLAYNFYFSIFLVFISLISVMMLESFSQNYKIVFGFFFGSILYLSLAVTLFLSRWEDFSDRRTKKYMVFKISSNLNELSYIKNKKLIKKNHEQK